MKKFYAIISDRKSCIVNSWPEAEKKVNGVKGARCKSFNTKAEAEAWLKEVKSALTSKKPAFYYAVAHGYILGVYDSWEKAREQVENFPCAIYKKFRSRSEAKKFIEATLERLNDR